MRQTPSKVKIIQKLLIILPKIILPSKLCFLRILYTGSRLMKFVSPFTHHPSFPFRCITSCDISPFKAQIPHIVFCRQEFEIFVFRGRVVQRTKNGTALA